MHTRACHNAHSGRTRERTRAHASPGSSAGLRLALALKLTSVARALSRELACRHLSGGRTRSQDLWAKTPEAA
eukprot:4976281-Alexandrium_andersonii.AAC.1